MVRRQRLRRATVQGDTPALYPHDWGKEYPLDIEHMDDSQEWLTVMGTVEALRRSQELASPLRNTVDGLARWRKHMDKMEKR